MANKPKCFYCGKKKLVSTGRYYGEVERVFLCDECWSKTSGNAHDRNKYNQDTTAYLFNLRHVLEEIHDVPE